MRLAILLALIAQAAVPDPTLTWIGLVRDLGSFGLIVWLIVYATPKWLREARDERDKRDTTTQAIIDKLNDRHDNRNKEIVDAIKEQTGKFGAAIKDSAQRIEDAVAKSCRARPWNGEERRDQA